jgi:hypothetical protein
MFFDQVADNTTKLKRLVIGGPDTIQVINAAAATHIYHKGALFLPTQAYTPLPVIISNFSGTFANQIGQRGVISCYSEDGLSGSGFIASAQAADVPDQIEVIYNNRAYGKMGSGGAGGSVAAGQQAGAGGGSGDRVIGTFNVTPGSILTVVVGAGGANNKNQTFGKNANFGGNAGDGGDGFVKISW